MKRYSRIFKYVGQYKKEIVLYSVFILFSIIFSTVSIGMLTPFMDLIFNGDHSAVSTTMDKADPNSVTAKIRFFIDETIQRRDYTVEGRLKALGFICILIVLSILLKNIFLVLSYYILNPLKNKVVNQLRTELYNKILHLPIGYFTEKRKGDLISRITNDIGEVEGSVIGALEGWVKDPLTIIGTFAVLFYISPQLTLFVFLFLPVMGLIIGRISRSLKKQSKEVAHRNSDAISILDETLSGLRVIKAFNVEPLLRDKYFSINNDLLTAKNRIGYRRDLASPMSEFLGVVVFCSILYFGGRLVLANQLLEPALFLTYLGLFYQIINPIKGLSSSFSNMQKGTAAIARIEEVLQAPNTVDDNENGKKLTSFNQNIELRNVSFSYDGVDVLRNINLKIEKGKTIALVGSSGAGKSTLADLIPRFHDVTAGELLIDGVNIKDYSLRSVREQISIVTQEPILFNDTIANNILIGKQKAGLPEIEEAATVANAHNFISRKEKRYDTNIGDRGTKLSGGERQRLTIARAVIKNPPILILDEATSALDTESERLVQDAINNMMQNRTSIVIAHRLSTIRHADEIIVLQKGQIVERGNHDQLLQNQGYYYKLVQMQEVK